jgi:hypothetical protein
MAKAAMLSPMAMLGKTGITGAAQAMTKLGGGGLTSLSPLASLLKGPSSAASTAGASSALAGLTHSPIPTPQFKPQGLGLPTPAKIDIKPVMEQGMQGIMDKMKSPSWLERNKGNIRDAGLSLMQMGMQQEQAPMQLAPFQPGGGGGAQGSGQGALMQLIQQYGLNKIQ